jgi:hypothetical protein
MKCRILVLSVVVVMLIGGSMLFARSIPGAPNEVVDPYFSQYQQGMPTWYISPLMPVPDPRLTPNPETTTFPGSYFDPGRNPGDIAFLRTIVDDYKGLWDPRYNQKEIDLSFFGHFQGGGYIKVKFDWWYDPGIPEPSNDPTDPSSPPPDGSTDWLIMTADDFGPFQLRPDLIQADEEPDWFELYNYHTTWDFQPRWVSIEIEVGIDPQSSVGGEALITGIDFEARCVPEPSVLVLIACGGLAMLLMRWRRR